MTYVLNPNLQASQLFSDKKDHTSILQINLMPLAGEDNLVHDLNGNSLKKKKNTEKPAIGNNEQSSTNVAGQIKFGCKMKTF